MPRLALVGVLLVAQAHAQTSAPSSACNNLTRTLLIGAGTSQTSVQCGQWSVVVSIAGQS
ncbi:MAG: hypothetical protein JNK02_17255, partial [Planctomycetes bacterium]|nr:hypothetical protein [Planctomycetota bacterium]